MQRSLSDRQLNAKFVTRLNSSTISESLVKIRPAVPENLCIGRSVKIIKLEMRGKAQRIDRSAS